MRRTWLVAVCLVAGVGLAGCGVSMQDSPTRLTPTATPPEPIPTTTQQLDSPSVTPDAPRCSGAAELSGCRQVPPPPSRGEWTSP
ncbi:MAG TPA: hypothetical protein VHF06_36120 [Pseudonocardiaceae bacterium]|nr:hypothetical protein [Pseudonocardiaceae bacterium]